MPRAPGFVVGVDLGTSSARAIVVDARDGAIMGQGESAYRHGRGGVIEDPRDPNLARQHPRDHAEAFDAAIAEAVQNARGQGVDPASIVGLGVDATGSTPMPIRADASPLAFELDLDDEPAALAWLWKDHTAHGEARELEAAGAAYLGTTGGAYSSEWFWAKALRCRRVAPEVARRAAGWAELGDVIVARAAGITSSESMPRGVCAAGHKGMFDRAWGGYPDAPFLESLSPGLSRWTPSGPVLRPGEIAGSLCAGVARASGLAPGIPIAGATLDAHAGALGAGVAPGVLVKIIGTSACDCMVGEPGRVPRSMPGVSGVVPDSILPGLLGIEAGQAAFGDLFDWHARYLGGATPVDHDRLTSEAAALAPGQSGLLAFDWMNGSRSVLCDPRLTGLILGQTLRTTPGEVHRALFEAAAFGARRIIEHVESLGVRIETIVACGGIAEKNPLVVRILADVCRRPILVRGASRACALGSAMLAAAACGTHASVAEAQRAMLPAPERRHEPDPFAGDVYERLYALHRELHDALGRPDWRGSLAHVMKRLIEIRESSRAT